MDVTVIENEVRKYLSYLSTVKRYSPHTTSSYQSDLEQLCLYVKQQKRGQKESITNRDLQLWVRQLTDQGCLPKSIQRKISSIRGFFKFYKKQHPEHLDPSVQLSLPKAEQKLPNYLTPHELRIAHSEINYDNISLFREYIVFALLSGCGLRRSEIIGLKKADIDLQSSTIRVLGKGNKQRIIPIEKSLAEELKLYIEEVQKSPNNSPWLIVTDKGKQAYPKLIERHVKSYLNRYFPHLKNSNPHMLRHSFATGLLQNGAGISDIKELLGHASLASTQIYTQTNVEQLKKIHKFHHPKQEKH